MRTSRRRVLRHPPDRYLCEIFYEGGLDPRIDTLLRALARHPLGGSGCLMMPPYRRDLTWVFPTRAAREQFIRRFPGWLFRVRPPRAGSTGLFLQRITLPKETR